MIFSNSFLLCYGKQSISTGSGDKNRTINFQSSFGISYSSYCSITLGTTVNKDTFQYCSTITSASKSSFTVCLANGTQFFTGFHWISVGR